MTVKDWLNRGYNLDREINALIREQERSLTMATKVTSVPSGNRVQTTKTNSSETRFVNYAAYSEMIDARIDKLYAIKQEILTAINSVNDTVLRQLLLYRYIEFMRWDDIAITMNYTDRRQMSRLHNKALKKVGEFIHSSPDINYVCGS